MAKAKKTTTKQGSKQPHSATNAVVVGALKRAIAAIEKLGPKGVKPEVGGHAVALDVRVVGDITVEAPGAPGETVSVTAKDLAAALLAGMPTGERDAMLKRALRLLVNAASKETSAAKLAKAADSVENALKVMAVDAGLVKPTAGRAGAIKGSPMVDITGTVAGNAVSLGVDTEGGVTGGVAA